VVKNSHIYHQTWGVLVTRMYFPIEVSFSLPIGEGEMDVEKGYELAQEKVWKMLDGLDTNPKYAYSFELELESDHNVDSENIS